MIIEVVRNGSRLRRQRWSFDVDAERGFDGKLNIRLRSYVLESRATARKRKWATEEHWLWHGERMLGVVLTDEVPMPADVRAEAKLRLLERTAFVAPVNRPHR